MSKMNVQCFGRNSELVSFKEDTEKMLVFEFPEEYDGYLSLGEITAKIKGKSCAVDTRRLADGEYTPHLILADVTVDLPKLKKQYGSITPTSPRLDEINSISLRERQLNERVSKLEKRIEEISEKVYGSSLFKPLP